MAEFSPENKPALNFEKTPRLKYLKARDVHMIDDALAQVGEFGEVHLVVERGRLRFLVTEKSIDVLKWDPNSPDRDGKEIGR
jgi:hypothetical protein